MSIDFSKLCSDFLRSHVSATSSGKLKATHARELTAAYFGYKSHAALLAERSYPISRLSDAAVLMPSVQLIAHRLSCLTDLPNGLASARELASAVGKYLAESGVYSGKIWLDDSIESCVTDCLLPDFDDVILDQLSGVMAETNAFFDETNYESAEVFDDDDLVRVEVDGQYNGTQDPDRMFCGDQIDMHVTVELHRVAGRIGFDEPDISASGTVNDDWVDPEFKGGASQAKNEGNVTSSQR